MDQCVTVMRDWMEKLQSLLERTLELDMKQRWILHQEVKHNV